MINRLIDVALKNRFIVVVLYLGLAGWGWWAREGAGHRVSFAWGYGGQLIFIIPALRATVVMTSDADARREWGHLDALHDLLDSYVIPELESEMGMRK